MGFTPQQVNEMSVWQFIAAVDGYVKSKGSDDGALSTAEVDELWEWVKEG